MNYAKVCSFWTRSRYLFHAPNSTVDRWQKCTQPMPYVRNWLILLLLLYALRGNFHLFSTLLCSIDVLPPVRDKNGRIPKIFMVSGYNLCRAHIHLSRLLSQVHWAVSSIAPLSLLCEKWARIHNKRNTNLRILSDWEAELNRLLFATVYYPNSASADCWRAKTCAIFSSLSDIHTRQICSGLIVFFLMLFVAL